MQRGAGTPSKAARRGLSTALGVMACLLGVAEASAQTEMRGHGGPVRALAVRAEARELISGSFDSTVIVWDLDRGVAKRVLRFHAGPVNAVALLPDGCFASAGEDKRIAIWCGGEDKPARVLSGHEAPVTALAASGRSLVSGSFDATVRIWDMADTKPADVLQIGTGSPTALAAMQGANGQVGGVVAGSADGTIAAWALHVDQRGRLETSVSAIASANDEFVAAGADGRLRFLKDDLTVAGELEVDAIPLSSLALSPDGRLIATAGLRGGVAIIERATRRILHRLTGPGLPVWSLAFDTDSRTLISGGADRMIRRWDAVEGRALSPTQPERDVVAEAAAGSERGAVVFRACQACHTLSPDDGNRAGPTLHGILGRRIGTAPGYVYSDALPRMSIVWSKETIAQLFEIGPNAFTPGTKMPEQTITDPADRQALVDWLERVTTQ